MSILQRFAISIVTGLSFATVALTPARATEPAQDVAASGAGYRIPPAVAAEGERGRGRGPRCAQERDAPERT